MLPLRNFLPPLFFFPLLPIEIIKEPFIISMLLPNFSPPSFLLPQISAKAKFPEAKTVKMHYYFLAKKQRPRNRGGGGIGGKCPPTFCTWGKSALFRNESALFSRNRSAVLAKLKCPSWSVPPHFRGASMASAKGPFIIYARGWVGNIYHKPNRKLLL